LKGCFLSDVVGVANRVDESLRDSVNDDFVVVDSVEFVDDDLDHFLGESQDSVTRQKLTEVRLDAVAAIDQPFHSQKHLVKRATGRQKLAIAGHGIVSTLYEHVLQCNEVAKLLDRLQVVGHLRQASSFFDLGQEIPAFVFGFLKVASAMDTTELAPVCGPILTLAVLGSTFATIRIGKVGDSFHVKPAEMCCRYLSLLPNGAPIQKKVPILTIFPKILAFDAVLGSKMWQIGPIHTD